MPARSGMKHPLCNPAPLIRRVYAYAVYRGCTESDAEDVTSETFERALRYVGSFDPRRGDTAAWLIGIARRVIADCVLREVPSDQLLDPSVEGHEADSVRGIDLAAAVSRLDEREREIIALRFGGDMTAREIARVLELRTNTVEVALHRALARLRVELGGGGPSDAPTYPAATPDTT